MTHDRHHWVAAVTPTFPRATDKYSKEYINEFIRVLELTLNVLRNPGHGRFTELTLTELVGSGYNKEVGEIFYGDDGVVKVVLPGITYVQGSEGNASSGTVTVSTT